MRWLLVKDAQILKRSPLLLAMLIVYPIAIALMIGFALSSPPGSRRLRSTVRLHRATGEFASAPSRST